MQSSGLLVQRSGLSGDITGLKFDKCRQNILRFSAKAAPTTLRSCKSKATIGGFDESKGLSLPRRAILQASVTFPWLSSREVLAEPLFRSPIPTNIYESDSDTYGRAYTLKWPAGWDQLKLKANARKAGVDCSFSNPGDLAETLAIFLKRVEGQASIKDSGSLREVVQGFEAAAPGQKNLGQRERSVLVDGKSVPVYEIETQVGGGTAGAYGAAVELIYLFVVDEIEYTVRATANLQKWPKARDLLRNCVRSFTFV